MSEDEKSNLEVILEDMNGKFDFLLEGHVTLEHMIHEHRAETQQDKRELQALIKTSHDSLDAKINKVTNELKETRSELKETRNELKCEIQSVRTELKEEIQAVDRKLTSEIRDVGGKVNRASERESALGQKVESHEDRIRFLERKVA